MGDLRERLVRLETWGQHLQGAVKGLSKGVTEIDRRTRDIERRMSDHDARQRRHQREISTLKKRRPLPVKDILQYAAAVLLLALALMGKLSPEVRQALSALLGAP